jgi:hypothetical protein
MKLGRLTQGGEVHALRFVWPFRRTARCHHGRGRVAVESWEGGAEQVTCQWCRVMLGLARLPKRAREVEAELVTQPAPAYQPSVLFAEGEVVEGGVS